MLSNSLGESFIERLIVHFIEIKSFSQIRESHNMPGEVVLQASYAYSKLGVS